MTDGEGKFALRDLDPTMLFQLLVLAPEHVPTFTEEPLDPLGPSPTIELAYRDLDDLPPERVVRGVVRDTEGRAVARAKIEPIAQKLARGTRYGALGGDPLAVSAADGSFAFTVTEPGAVVQVETEAVGLTRARSGWLTAGAENNVVTLVAGVTLTGRIQHEGKPVAGFALGLTQEDQNAAVNVGTRSIASDAQGRFTFVNVLPDETLQLYGELASHELGALSARRLSTGADRATLDLGLFTLEKGSTLAGRVVTSDGGALPEGTALVLSRESLNDTAVLVLASDGTFRAHGLPPELLTLDVGLRNYHVSEENESYDFVNHQGLLGRVDADLELELLLDPGPKVLERTPRAPDKSLWERYEKLQSTPLRGRPRAPAEPAPR